MSNFICSRCQQPIQNKYDRAEVKLEIVRAGDHGRRFHSKVLAHICRRCGDEMWPELIGEQTAHVQEALAL